MTSNSSTVRPPRAAAWLVELFASTHEADGVLGDLAEEFIIGVRRGERLGISRCIPCADGHPRVQR
jgi:hypothetical protein